MRRWMLACVLAAAMASTAWAGQGHVDQAFESALADYQVRQVAMAAQPAAPAQGDQPAGGNWLGLGEQLAQASRPAQTQPSGPKAGLTEAEKALPYVPYEKRRGPAYPGDMLRSLGRDGKEFLPMVWDDTKSIIKQPISLVAIGLAGAAGIAINGSGADRNIAHQTARNGHELNSFWDTVGDAGGNPGTHFALAGVAYFASQYLGDTKLYETSKTMLSALAINGSFTMLLKVAARTRSPNGDSMGWPSGHTSSSFAFATVLNESYGPWVGVPAFLFASYVGYERVDARNHDFSDVISGALIGYAIGYAVSKNHEWKVLGMDIVPLLDAPNGSVGLALAKEW